MIRALLLDVDGTLIDSNDAHAQAWMEALKEEGYNVPLREVRRRIGMGGDNLLPSLLGISDSDPKAKTMSHRHGEIFREKYLRELKPFPGVRELIDHLRGLGLQLVIATSSKKKDLELLLGQAGLKDLLLDSTSADDASSSKPSPDIVQAAWKKTGCRKEEVLMIGDTPYDIEAAKRAGVRIIALTCGGWTRDELKDRGADAVYTDLADLLENLTTSPILSAAEIGSGPPQH